MITPWCEQQREAVRAFRKAIALRAQREARDRRRRAGPATRRGQALRRGEGPRRRGIRRRPGRCALTRGTIARQTARTSRGERAKLQREYKKGKEKNRDHYLEAKAKHETEFRDSRWTTSTVYDADKRIAKEHMMEEVAVVQVAVAQAARPTGAAGRKLIEPLDFLDDIAAARPAKSTSAKATLGSACKHAPNRSLPIWHALETLRSPSFINGRLPWLIVFVVWLALSASRLSRACSTSGTTGLPAPR